MFRRTPRPNYYSHKYYESSYSDLHNIAEHEKTALVLLEARTNDIFRDIGCGCGTFLREVAQDARWAVGIDYSKVAVKMTKLNIRSVRKADVVRASSTHLPFRSELFAKLSTLEVLEHLDKRDSVKAVNEI